jgi:hypothetical protein
LSKPGTPAVSFVSGSDIRIACNFLVDHLSETSGLEPAVSPDQLRSAVGTLSEREVRKVLGYVPYRFPTSWFRPVLRGLASDAGSNMAIRLFAARRRRAARPSPYWFDQISSYASRILLDRTWLVFPR